MIYLFGSKLINTLIGNNKFRPCNDTDYVTNDLNEYLELKSKKTFSNRIEYHYIPFSPNRLMTLDEIYTVKCSHATRNIHWKKTMSDIRYLQTYYNCKLIESFHNELKSYWNEVHGINIRTSFDEQTTNTFFNDNVIRRIPHDVLHTYVIPDGATPAYKLIVDNVIPDIHKYYNLLIEDRIRILTEEAYVLAIERYNMDFSNFSIYNEYINAQLALITRLHPEWLAEEAIKTWKHIFKPKYNYKDEFHKRTLINVS